MQQNPLEEAFRYCVENPDHLSTAELLSKFPEYREALQPLLVLDRQLDVALVRPLPAPARATIKAQMRAASTPTAPAPPGRSARRLLRGMLQPQPRRFRVGRVVSALLAAVVLVVVLGYVSAIAPPDDPFYGLKLTTESGLLPFAGNTAGLARRHVELANRRLQDLRSMQVVGKLEQAGPAFANYSQHLDAGVALWRDLRGDARLDLDKLLYPSSVAGQHTFAGFVTVRPSLSAALQVRIAGILASLNALNAATGQELRTAQVDLDQLVRHADAPLGLLLTPLPGVALPTETATATRPATPPPSPVACADQYEDDGVAAQAKPLQVGDTQIHFFCLPSDADWLIFSAGADQGYEIDAAQFAGGADAYMFLFAPDGQTVLARSSAAPSAPGTARILFAPLAAGRYYIQVKNEGDRAGPSSLSERTVFAPIGYHSVKIFPTGGPL
jgi:hypothetical protein